MGDSAVLSGFSFLIACNVPRAMSKNEVPLQLLAGSIAGIVADGTTHPVDTIRANL